LYGDALFEALEEQLEGVGSLEEGFDGQPRFSIDVPDPECFAKAVARGSRVASCAQLADNSTLQGHLLENSVQNAVVFPLAYLRAPDVALNVLPMSYTMYYNRTLSRYPYRRADHALELKVALDEAIANLATRGRPGAPSEVALNVTWRPFPRATPRVSGFSAVGWGGGYWFYLPPMFVFFTLLTEVVREKECRMRMMMRVMGLANAPYWAAWFLQGAAFSVAAAVILIASGCLCGFDVFWNASWLVLFLLFGLLGIAMSAAALMVSTLVKSVKAAQTIGYGVILVGFVFQTVICTGYGSLLYMFFSLDMPAWTHWVRRVLLLYPPFNMSLVYYMVSQKAGATLNMEEAKIVEARAYRWADLFVEPAVNKQKLMAAIDVHVPSAATALLLLAGNTVLFLFLTLYLDYALEGTDGDGHGLFFWASPAFWRRSRRDPRDDEAGRAELLAGRPEEQLSVDEGVNREEVEAGRCLAASPAPVTASAFAAGAPPLVVAFRLSKRFVSGFGQWAALLRRRPRQQAKGVQAVQQVSLCLRPGEIFCLLGHNGAGKTTTLNILTGLTPLSGGDATICGRSVRHDMGEIRTRIGVCPQFDCLWGNLSAQEHLEIFGAIKGIRAADLAAEARARLDQVKLGQVAPGLTGTFSGGMRRRLSVAVACIGDPRVVFLDEPTTGMDPSNRQAAWKMIQEMKEGRVVILTTHSMEEADCLGTRIGIMGKGRMLCVGTPLALRTSYGDGYRLHVNTARGEGSRVESSLHGILPSIRLLSAEASALTDNLKFSVPFRAVADIPDALDYLEQSKDDVREWGISQCTLEEVFLTVTKASGFGAAQEEPPLREDAPEGKGKFEEDAPDAPLSDRSTGSGSSRASPPVSPASMRRRNSGRLTDRPPPGPAEQPAAAGLPDPKLAALRVGPWRKQLYAARGIFAKNLRLQRRNGFESFCQLAIPVLVMFVLVLIQAIVASQEKKLGALGGRHIAPSVTYALQGGVSFDVPKEMLAQFANTSVAQSVPEVAAFLDGGANFSTGKHCFQKFLVGSAAGLEERVGPQGARGRRHGLLGALAQHTCILAEDDKGVRPNITVPHFEWKADVLAMDAELFGNLETLNDLPILEVEDEPYPSYLLADGTVFFRELSYGRGGGQAVLDFEVSSNDVASPTYHRPNGLSRSSLPLPANFSGLNMVKMDNQARISLVDKVFQGYMAHFYPWHQRVRNLVPRVAWPALGLENSLASMPEVKDSPLASMVEIAAALFIPVALSLQLPTQLHVTVMEKETGLHDLQRSHGMTALTYRCASAAFNLTVYSAVALFLSLAGRALGLQFFVETGPGILAAFLTGWGLSLVALAFFLSACTHDSRVAGVVGYTIVLFGTGFGLMVCQGVYGDTGLREQSPVMPPALNLWPQFAMIRAVYLLNFECAAKQECATAFSGHPELARSVGFLFLDAVLLALAGVYLEEVLPSPGGLARRHPLFFLPRVVREGASRIASALLCRRRHHRRASIDDGSLLSPKYRSEVLGRMSSLDSAKSGGEIAAAPPPPQEDSDVLLEQERAAGAHLEEHALVARELRREFQPSTPGGPLKVAVGRLNLVLNHGECFGLLGENGAGKTTLIKMLGASLAPTSGSAHICGFSTQTETAQVHRVLGFCPQHDVLWSRLTVREHLLLYARLKGVSIRRERELAQCALESVGLAPQADRLSSQLSGGMRRRLSVAIALVGDSQVVLLDEMTTGLDPASRRQLWHVLAAARQGRAMLLTTHSMEEAELLCTRIGVMSSGLMNCIGTSQRLRAEYGAGSVLLLNFGNTPEARGGALAFVSATLPGAVLEREFEGQAVFHLPPRLASPRPEGSPAVNRLPTLADIFREMAGGAEAAGITSWSVQQAGLEEVFLTVVERARAGVIRGRPKGFAISP
jgi:ABC-type multidrug transport system ATPase subunit